MISLSMYQYTPYILPLLLSASVLVVLGVFAWRQQDRMVRRAFLIFILALLIWTCGFILEITAIELQTKIFWASAQFLGIAFLPITWLLITLDYTGFSRYVKQIINILSIVPIITLFLIWTNETHHLFRGSPYIDTQSGPFPILVNDYGFWFYWILAPYSYIIFVVSFILLIRSFAFTTSAYRKQILLLLFSLVIPLVVDVFYVFGISPIPHFNLTPVAFSIAGVTVGGALFRYRFLDLMPVARSTLVNILEDAWIVLDDADRFVDLNPAAQAVLGRPSKEVVGQPITQFLADRPDLLSLFQVNQKWRTEIELEGKGHQRFYELRLTPLQDKYGRISGRLILLHDISVRKEAEKALRELSLAAEEARCEAELANQAKSRFLASMSHELRTPLNGILGYAQILKQDSNLTVHHREGLEIIERSGEHLLSLINDILDLAKIEADKIELYKTDFHLPTLLKVVGNMIHTQILRKDIQFKLEIRNLPAIVYGDERRLRQILVNLLGNAVKFTDRGCVTLRVQSLDAVANNSSDMVLRFEIIDTGVGIAAEDLGKIFQPFTQTQDALSLHKGTGLGLAISRQLTTLMGGEIMVDSKPGEGSRFWFDVPLPVIQNSLEQQDTAVPIRRIRQVKGKPPLILLVDDISDNRKLLVDMLQPLGFKIYEASNGQDGLKTALEVLPHAIITDLVMPGMDGVELIHHIRHVPTNQNTIILATSASVQEIDYANSLLAGANAFIPKPVKLDTLLSLLQRHLLLEWVYEEPERVVIDENRSAEETLLVFPSIAELTTLHEMALAGDIAAIRQTAVSLEAQGLYKPFALHIHHLAKTFQINDICTLLEGYIREKS